MDFLRNAVHTVTACCLNCHEDTAQAWSNGGEPTERTGLLIDQQRRNVVNSPVRRISEDDMTEYPSSLPKRDEQTALNSIVHQTNANIIDVAALDTHLLEQSEYNDRAKIYAQRLAHQWNNIQVNDSKYNGLLKDVPNPEQLLATNHSQDELAMIRNFCKDAAQAVIDIKVENNDELVVPFLIT